MNLTRKVLVVVVLISTTICYIELENDGKDYQQRIEEYLLFTLQDQHEAVYQKVMNQSNSTIEFKTLQSVISTNDFQSLIKQRRRNVRLRSFCFMLMTLICVYTGIIFSTKT